MDISVVIPTYNRLEVLQRALNSIYSQSYQATEIIVIDDGSTDDTSKIQEIFPKIKYIYQNNKGVSSARNRGIKNSNCYWIAFLDSDDEWHEDKLKHQVEFHKNNPDILMSYTDETWIRDGDYIKIPKKFKKIDGDVFLNHIEYCNIAPSSVIIHKNLLDEIGLFDESLRVCEDYDLWLRIALENKIGLIDKKLINKYGGADDQLSTKFWGMDRYRVKSLEKILTLELKKEQKDILLKTLINKYKVLLKGAIKYDKIAQIKEYKIKIERFNNYE